MLSHCLKNGVNKTFFQKQRQIWTVKKKREKVNLRTRRWRKEKKYEHFKLCLVPIFFLIVKNKLVKNWKIKTFLTFSSIITMLLTRNFTACN